MQCRACASTRLTPRFSLGEQMLSEFPKPTEPLPKAYPLNLVECEDCTLVQLDYTVPRDEIYKHYWFLSSTSQQNVEALRDVVKSLHKRVQIQQDDIWVDVGSNDATLLKLVPDSCVRIGFEHASNLTQNYPIGTVAVNDYFKAETYNVLTPVSKKKAKVVSAIAMFYDLEEPHKFVEDVKQILAPDGLFVVQQNYLVSMLVNNVYDNICHEHVAYYSLRSLESVLSAHDLEVVDVELNDVNGGSFRTYVQHKGQTKPRQSVRNLRKYEERQLTPQAWVDFKERVEATRTKLVEFLTDAKSRGKRVMGIGASNRGHVILQYCEIGPSLVQAFVERHPDKIGRTTVTRIPIVDEEVFQHANPDYVLVLPYHLRASIITRYLEYLDKGGHLILPLPTPRVIGKSGNTLTSRQIK